MSSKNFRRWLIVLASVGLVAGFQGAVLAATSSDWLQSLFGGQGFNNNNDNNENPPDQKQIEADKAMAAQLQQTYQNDRQALAQAYRSGDRQRIQELQAALNLDIQRLQANDKDLAKAGVANPYNIPDYPYYQGSYDRSYNQGSMPPGWSHGRKTGWNGRNVPPGYGRNDRQWENRGPYTNYNQANRQWSWEERSRNDHNDGQRNENSGD